MTKQPNQGYSLIELLIVVTLTGVMAMIAIPNFVSFLYRQNLNASTRELYQGIRRAQGEALGRKEFWQFSIRDNGDRVEWAIHPQGNPVGDPTIQWYGLDRNIQLSTNDSINTVPTVKGTSIYQLTFSNNGQYIDRAAGHQTAATVTPDYTTILPEISLKLSGNVDSVGYDRRCVKIATLLGALRLQKDSECQ